MGNFHHILHLSDLHFDPETSADSWYSQLAEDLRGDMINCRKLDALIISGDVANFSERKEYDQAKADQYR